MNAVHVVVQCYSLFGIFFGCISLISIILNNFYLYWKTKMSIRQKIKKINDLKNVKPKKS